MLRSDQGGEYESPFVDLCTQHAIIHETIAPYSPQSNGVAERKNRTLKEMMNAMRISSSLQQNMWGEAILSANYLLNKVPKKKAEKTPYELWKGMKPSYKYLRVWGCLAKVAVPQPKKVRIRPKTIDCIFIGYAHNSAAYRFLVYESNIPDIHQNTIMESRNASFFEDVFPYGSKEKPSSSKRVLETIHENSQDEDTDGEVEPRRSKRARTEKSFGPDFLTYMLEGEPQTYKKAVNSTKSLMWKKAIKSEIDSILHNHTWELVDLPSGCKPLSSKWIFKRKRKVDGSVDKYKARLRYSDANWISNDKDSKSLSGYVFTLGGAAVSWKSSKQMVIARSTMEYEFIALDKCGEEAEWLRHFLEDIQRWPKPVPPICIHCDSQSAIGRAQNSMYNGKSRHIRCRHSNIKQKLSIGLSL